MDITRRQILGSAALAGGYVLAKQAGALAEASNRQTTQSAAADRAADQHFPPGRPGADYTPVVVPNGWTLPFKIVDGVKVFHLVAEEVEHEFAPGLKAKCWGYNGSVHGPVIEAVEGDRVRIFVTNKLEAGTTVHWHGIILPSGMDGVGGLNQAAIKPGETFMYEFPLVQHGTFMYHAHHDEMTQMGLGMTGMFVIHPRGEKARQNSRPDRDFVIMLHEWKITPGTDRPDPNEMVEFNVLTMNARVFPGTDPLVVKKGDKVRIRFGNLGAMDHHPIHLHGHSFKITETGGGPIPESAQWPEATVLVSVGTTRTIEFEAAYPGDWAMHCHMTHHVMNQMGHGQPLMIGVKGQGLDEKVRPLLPMYMTMGTNGMADMGEMSMKVPPNSIPMVGGMGPHDYITMGGMFTILKTRENLRSYDEDPGWYQTPADTLATGATPEALQQNGIAVDGSNAPRPPGRVNAAPPVAPEKPPASGPTEKQLYTCVMHPEVVSDKPGNCPICGMKLVPKK